jgi:asparagine synthase (glutamine-hydrolysing)
MAVFLAALAIGGARLPDGLAERVRSVIAEAGTVDLQANAHSLLAYSDLALWPGSSCVETAEGWLVVAGDPVLYVQAAAQPRPAALSAIGALLDDTGTLLRGAEGTFCGVLVNFARRQLVAFTDKLGVRPLYWAVADGVVYVASAQWVLDGLPQVPRHPDWQASVEAAAFGYPMGDRTLNRDVRVLLAGHLLAADEAGAHARAWWDWTQLARCQLAGDDLVAAVTTSFGQAVAARVQGQRRAFAFLSGGMDSRLIVSTLRAQDVGVYSMNFAPEGSQDLAFGRRAAEVLRTTHFEYGDGDAAFAERRVAALAAWFRAFPDRDAWPEQLGLVWSGDGGSVGLGHVYLSEAIVDTARRRGLESAAEAIQVANQFVMSSHVLRRGSAAMKAWPLRAIVEDLNSRPGVEPGRNAHLFFMFNDQRRHLAAHYESVHRTRIDLVLPFFDGRFLSTVLSAPVDPFLGHHLYNQLMVRLPDGSGTVPWQAYPGHEPCPVPVPDGLRRQWEDGWFDPAASRRARRTQYREAMAHTLSRRFPAHVLSRPVLLLAAAAGLLGIERFGYMTSVLPSFMQVTDR